MRGRPRGKGGAPTQCFSVKHCEVLPISSSFHVSGFYEIPCSLIPPHSSTIFETSTKSESWGQLNLGWRPRPRRYGGIVGALLTTRCPVGTALLGRRKPGSGAVRAERAAPDPVLICAALRGFTDLETLGRLRILRDPVQPHPPTQLYTLRDFEISTKRRRWGQPNPGRCPRPGRFSGIVSAFLSRRCPVGTLLLGNRAPGRGAVRAETATREPSASPCSVSRCPISRCFDASGFYEISYSLIPLRSSILFGISRFRRKVKCWGQPTPGRCPGCAETSNNLEIGAISKPCRDKH